MKRSIKERQFQLQAVFLIVTFLVTAVAHADDATPYCQDEACFPETVSPLGMTLKKTTSARYRYYGFHVFDSSLYLESPAALEGDFLGKKPCALKLCYQRTLTADEFRRSGSETLALNPQAPIAQLQSRMDLLHARYQDMHEGDCYQLSFKPGVGMELARNGISQIIIPGDDFARYYLGIWLSPYSFSESLTKKLTTN